MSLLKYKNAKKLHLALFSEEYDYMGDSYADSCDRNSGKNPMNQEYQAKVNRKRELLEVSPLSSGGLSADESAMEFCIKEIQAARLNKETDYTKIALQCLKEIQEDNHTLHEEIEARLTLVKGIDPEDPRTWTKTMINNSYAIMEAGDRWEMESTMPFEEFTERLFSDKNFARKNAPRGKSDQDDYNPWG